MTGAVAVQKTARQARATKTEAEFLNMQIRLSATDSMDTAVDSSGKLIPGQFVSPASLVGEVNRLLKEKWTLLVCVPVGQDKIGANTTGVNVKLIFARGTKFKPQKQFSFLLIAENASTMNEWQGEMQSRFKQGFSLFGEPKAIASSRAGVNMWYSFVK